MHILAVDVRWRWPTVGVALVAALWLCYGGLTHAVAAHYGESPESDDWSRAASLESGNAENWDRLGRFRQLDFEHADLPLAVSYLRKAVQLDPRSAFYKEDLASALEMNGQSGEAATLFEQAQANYPSSAEVSWRYGNFLLRQQRLPEAYAELRRALAVDPKMLPLGVSRAWHSNPDVRVLLDQVLPDTDAADWEAISFLTQEQESVAAQAVWKHLIERKSSVELKKALPLVDLLIQQQHFDEARSVWVQAIGAAGGTSAASEKGSLVSDGGFESDLANGGLGWRQQEVPGAVFAFDSVEKHSGARAARISFDGSQNPAYRQLFQYLVVSPGTRYRFQGFLRTENITTESGMRFEIADPKNSELDVLTPSETGTHPWTLEETEFTSGPQTRLLMIALSRKPSARLANALSGTVWIDDVSVVPMGPNR